MRQLFRVAFGHRADLLAALVYGCLAFLSFSALSEYANAHRLFPLPYGGWAFAVAIDMTVLYAFISFKRAPWLAGILLVSGAASTYTLQRWHAQGAQHPLMVAGVVPALMVLITFTWHRIKAAEARPDWPIPTPPPPQPDPTPDPAVPDETRPRVAQDSPRGAGPVARGRPAFTPAQATQVERWVAAGRTNRAEMARDLGLSDRGTRQLRTLVDALLAQPTQVGHQNGDGS